MESQSKHRDQPIGRFFKNVWFVKRNQCLAGITVCVLLVTYILRSQAASYQASVRMFAQMSRKGQSNSSAVVSIPEMERITFIANQEELLTSYPLYLKVRRSYDEPDWPSAIKTEQSANSVERFKNLKSVLNKIIFGKDYSDDSLAWNDSEYTEFVKRLSFEQKPSSGTFIITYSDPDPRRAVKITKLISDCLVDLNYDIVNKKKKNLVQYLESKKQEAQTLVNESRDKIASFLVVNNFSDNQSVIDAKIKQYIGILDTYNQDLLDKETESLQTELSRHYVENTTKAIRGEMVQGSDQKLQSILSELGNLQTNKIRREASYGAESNYYDKQIDSLRTQLNKILNMGVPVGFEAKSALINQLQQLQTQREINLAGKIKKLSATKELRDKYEKEINKFPELQAKLSNLLFDHQQYLKMLQVVSESLLSTNLQGDSELTQLFSIQEPMINNPALKKGLKLIIGIIALSILYLVTFGIFHFLRGTIFSKYDLMIPNLPKHYFMGSIPRQSKYTSGRLSRYFGGSDAILKDAQSLKHHLALKEETKGTVIQFWSEKDASGKSVTTFAMALALKDLGHSVLVLDCDFRPEGTGLLKYAAREKNRRHISVQNNLQGIISYLEDSSESEEFVNSKVVISSPIANGTNKKEAYVYFDTYFEKELTLLKNHFDFILLDAPPLSIGQGLLTSPLADAIVLCCPEGKITQGGYAEMLHYIDSYCGHNTKILSLITMSLLKINREAMEIGNRDRTLSRRLRVAA